jgi:hypothetical protein
VSLKMEANAPGSSLSVLNPDGSTRASNTIGGVPATFFEPVTLTTTGTHSLLLDPLGANTGTATMTLYDVAADLSGTITPGGSSVSAGITAPGQNGSYTFSGTSGQRVSLKVDAGAPGGTTTLKKPDGTSLGLITMGGSTAFMDLKTLTDTGTHTVAVDPTNWNTGTAVLTLYNVPADIIGTLTINGSAEPVPISTPGQGGSFTFNGSSSQAVTVRVTGNNMSVTVKLLRPDGTTMTSALSSSSSFNLTQQTLPTTGTYTVVVDPFTTSTGSLNVAVTSP